MQIVAPSYFIFSSRWFA